MHNLSMSYTLGKRLIKVPHIGLANLIAQQRIIPELIQENAKWAMWGVYAIVGMIFGRIVTGR